MHCYQVGSWNAVHYCGWDQVRGQLQFVGKEVSGHVGLQLETGLGEAMRSD